MATESDRRKNAAQWFYNLIFGDEPIPKRAAREADRLPAPLLAARSLETAGAAPHLQSGSALFLKQAKLLATYEDDFSYDGSVIRYFPTYQSLTDPELRGYFSWRTKLRAGEVRTAPLTFAYLYIFELINQVGVTDPMDGYRKLEAFRSAYAQVNGAACPHLDEWRTDYCIYYGLDAELLADTPQVLFDKSVCVLEQIHTQPQDAVMRAVKQLAPKWLARSRFYADFAADCDRVITRVLRRISTHFDKRCKCSLVESWFGGMGVFQTRLFYNAVFCDPLKIRSAEYALDARCVYCCKNGFWTVRRDSDPTLPSEMLNALVRAIDCTMRQEYGYRYPLKDSRIPKYQQKIILEETHALLAEKAAAEAAKISIDYTKLARIRRDAAVTRDKLIVEEETDAPEAPTAPAAPCEAAAPASGDSAALSQAEYRLLQCLLYGGDCGWVRSQGYLPSVLTDGINEKLYDRFCDCVLTCDEPPALVADYIDELKEMVHP